MIIIFHIKSLTIDINISIVLLKSSYYGIGFTKFIYVLLPALKYWFGPTIRGLISTDPVEVTVGVTVGVTLWVGVLVTDGVAVSVGTGVLLGINVGVVVGVGVGFGVVVGVGFGVDVGVGDGMT